MSIESAITNAQQKVANAYTAVNNKGGTLPATQDLSNLPTAINTISTAGAVETLNVTPTTSAQIITPSAGVDGFNPVNVSAVTSSIDPNITASNIVSGKSILGVNGSATVLNGETRSVSLTSSSGQTFTPSTGKNGITSITVTPNNQNRTVTPTTSQQSLTVNSGYSGNGTITVNAVTSAIDSDIQAGNIKSGVNILGVTGTLTPVNNTTLSATENGTYTPSSPYTGYGSVEIDVDTVNNTNLSVTPTTSAQSFTPSSPYTGYGSVSVAKVTSAIDSNIVAGNIKSGVSILGVTGTVTQLVGETRTVSITSTAGNTFTPSSGKNGITSIKVTPTNKAQTITPSTSSQTLTVPTNYSGYGTLTVNAVTSAIDSNISAGNIKDGITILGVTGTFDPSPTINSLNVTPTTSAQTITASGGVDGYSPVNVSAVTSSIDPNITPNKIRNGVNILGVTGTYGESLPRGIYLNTETSGYLVNGDFYLCGRNNYGQQGTGDTTNVTTFRKVAENVAQIYSSSTTGYLTTSGDFYLCGRNTYGQQGTGDTTDVTTFRKVAENVAQMYSGSTTGYLTTSGDFYLCGYNGQGQQGTGDTTNVTTFRKVAENVAQIFLTSYTSGYLTTSGYFYLCGRNNYYQQGKGNNTTDVTTFTIRAENVAQIFLTTDTTGYVTTSGYFYLCGRNFYGQQGSGNTTDVTTFTKRAENVAQIFLSYNESGYITTSGDFYLCGSNEYGEQGNGTSGMGYRIQTFTKRAENVAQIGLAGYSSGYITTSGDFYLCGWNPYGQQGNGTSGTGTQVKIFTKRN